MFEQVGRPSGPSSHLRCEDCGTVFEVDRATGKNTVLSMAWRATDNRGGQRLESCLVPKCPHCGAQ